MSKFKIYLEYDGTRYSGWQKQKNAKTVQGTLFRIAEEIFKDSSSDIQGCGRTDSGVHALNYVAHLDVKTMLAPEIIKGHVAALFGQHQDNGPADPFRGAGDDRDFSF